MEKRQAQMDEEQAKKAKKKKKSDGDEENVENAQQRGGSRCKRRGGWGRSRKELRQVKVLEQENDLSREELLIEKI